MDEAALHLHHDGLLFLSLTTVPWRIRFGMVLTLGLGSAALLGEKV